MSRLLFVALSCVLIGTSFPLMAAEPSRPNVLLILVDDPYERVHWPRARDLLEIASQPRAFGSLLRAG